MTPEQKDAAAREQLRKGDADKIDRKLEELGVAKSKSGADQRDQPDSEGSASSSKNLDQE
jgi:hypothetical protein